VKSRASGNREKVEIFMKKTKQKIRLCRQWIAEIPNNI